MSAECECGADLWEDDDGMHYCPLCEKDDEIEKLRAENESLKKTLIQQTLITERESLDNCRCAICR